jgi:hypothetical protein
MAEAGNNHTFHTKPVAQVPGDIRLIAKIVKILAKDFEMQVLEPDAELPRLAVRRY